MVEWPINEWFVAMLAVLPLMFSGRVVLPWVLLMGASLSAAVLPWWLIDAAGAIVFACWPCQASYAISILFGAMLIADFGGTAREVGLTLGWMQIVLLIVWAVIPRDGTPNRPDDQVRRMVARA